MRSFLARIVLAAITSFLCVPAYATTLIGPVVNPANGHHYYLLDKTTWTASQAEAVTLGGNLVTINDAAENAWVLSNFGNGASDQVASWIGYSDVAVEGTFVWASGETPGYTNWGSGEPSDSGPLGQDHGLMASSVAVGILPGEWGDINEVTQSEYPIYGVVEVVPEPTVMAMFLVGSIRLLAGRRSTQTSFSL